jgi:hypothetical protein
MAKASLKTWQERGEGVSWEEVDGEGRIRNLKKLWLELPNLMENMNS